MPLTPKDSKVERSFSKTYGDKQGKRVFFATLNKRINQGRAINIPESQRLKDKRKPKRSI